MDDWQRACVEIQQLAIRYAHAVDARDLDALADLWVPDVWMGRDHGEGPAGVRSYFEPVLRRFYRSIHMIVGHRVEVVDDDTASGVVYCRAEHESGDDWVVQAIAYRDEYRRVDSAWRFAKRRHHHWYSTPIERAPAPPSFEHWPGRDGPLPDLPHLWPAWERYWATSEESTVSAASRHPGPPTGHRRGGMRVDALDRVELHELAARYAVSIDDRRFDDLRRVFTPDASFRTSGFPNGAVDVHGIDEIVRYMERSRHPVAHQVTNVVVDDVDGAVHMRSTIIGTGPRGRVGSADYRDRVVRAEEGWRIAERQVQLRAADRES